MVPRKIRESLQKTVLLCRDCYSLLKYFLKGMYLFRGFLQYRLNLKPARCDVLSILKAKPLLSETFWGLHTFERHIFMCPLLSEARDIKTKSIMAHDTLFSVDGNGKTDETRIDDERPSSKQMALIELFPMIEVTPKVLPLDETCVCLYSRYTRGVKSSGRAG